MRSLLPQVKRLERRHGQFEERERDAKNRAIVVAIVTDPQARQAGGRIAEARWEFGSDDPRTQEIIKRETPAVVQAVENAGLSFEDYVPYDFLLCDEHWQNCDAVSTSIPLEPDRAPRRSVMNASAEASN